MCAYSSIQPKNSAVHAIWYNNIPIRVFLYIYVHLMLAYVYHWDFVCAEKNDKKNLAQNKRIESNRTEKFQVRRKEHTAIAKNVRQAHVQSMCISFHFTKISYVVYLYTCFNFIVRMCLGCSSVRYRLFFSLSFRFRLSNFDGCLNLRSLEEKSRFKN